MTAEQIMDAIRASMSKMGEHGVRPHYVTMHPEVKSALVGGMADRLTYKAASSGADNIMGLELLTNEKADRSKVYVSVEPLWF